MLKKKKVASSHAARAHSPLETVEELLIFAEHAYRTRMKAKYPKIKKSALEKLVKDWYQDRPGASLGDCDGVLRKL